jgi:hypothetical protein
MINNSLYRYKNTDPFENNVFRFLKIIEKKVNHKLLKIELIYKTINFFILGRNQISSLALKAASYAAFAALFSSVLRYYGIRPVDAGKS